MRERIIISSNFLEEIVSNAAFLYPKESSGALKGREVKIKSESGIITSHIFLEGIYPFEEIRRTRTSSYFFDDREMMSKIKSLNKKRFFLGTYHSHTYPKKRKLPKNDDLSVELDRERISDIRGIKETWKSLANYKNYNPLSIYFEFLVSIRQIQSRKPREHKLFYSNFPYLEFFQSDHKGFQARVYCFAITADEQFKKLKKGRLSLHLILE